MEFANPFFACTTCGYRVTGVVNSKNDPCGHRMGYHDLCPSWSPVDGCNCLKLLGAVHHRTPVLPPRVAQ